MCGEKEKKIIAIDMDEVLTETMKGILKFYKHQLNGKPLDYEDIVSYNLREIPGFEDISVEYSLNYFVKFLKSSASILAEPIFGAREKLEYYKKLGYHFVVITGRGTDVEESTRAYIEKYYPTIFDEIYFCAYNTDHQLDKFTVCENLGITMIVEDHLENSIKYTQHGIDVILLDKPRNQHYNSKIHHNIKKVSSWKEIVFDC